MAFDYICKANNNMNKTLNVEMQSESTTAKKQVIAHQQSLYILPKQAIASHVCNE